MPGKVDAEDGDRGVDVLQKRMFELGAREGYLVPDLVEHRTADADPGGLREGFNARGDVHCVSKEVASLVDDVPQVNPDSELDSLGSRPLVMIEEHTLYVNRAFQRLERARELHEEAIPHSVDLAAAVRLEDRTHERALGFQETKGEGLVPLGEGRITHHIGEHDGGEPSGRGHDSKTASVRLISRARSSPRSAEWIQSQ